MKLLLLRFFWPVSTGVFWRRGTSSFHNSRKVRHEFRGARVGGIRDGTKTCKLKKTNKRGVHSKVKLDP